MKLESLRIGELTAKIPVIQGGMGVGVSLSGLAGAVAACGGVGIISTAQIGYRDPEFDTKPIETNLRAIGEEVSKARKIAGNGIIGVNIMVALTHYGEMVKTAINAGAQLIISGAGLPLDLPLFTKDTPVKTAPIVSSGKAASVICRMWDRKHTVCPDCLIVEGPLAGGHLGFKLDELDTPLSVLELAKDVQLVAKEYGEKYQKDIPVIVAGGIYTGEDVHLALESGVDGVQMATRFVTTHECDAHPHYKEAYLKANKEQIGIVKSPVGMPGRAIFNSFITTPPGNHACLYHCIEKCHITNIPYCISKALIAAATGDVDNALLFCGSNAYRAQHLESVNDIMNEIKLAIS